MTNDSNAVIKLYMLKDSNEVIKLQKPKRFKSGNKIIVMRKIHVCIINLMSNKDSKEAIKLMLTKDSTK